MSRIPAAKAMPLQGPLGSPVQSGITSTAQGGAGTVAGQAYVAPQATIGAAPSSGAITQTADATKGPVNYYDQDRQRQLAYFKNHDMGLMNRRAFYSEL